MRAGDLRHRVTIQQKSVTRDTYGAEVVSWTDVVTVWAEITDLSGREYFDAQKVNAEVNTKVRIRHRTDLVPTMRVVEGSRTLEVLAVIDTDGRKRETVLMCKEVVD